MGFLNLFSGKTPEALEQKGDSLARANAWGMAKIEYEKALDRLEKRPPVDDKLKKCLEEKVSRAREALAQGHQKSAEDMLEAGFYDDVRQYIDLALELTGDQLLKTRLRDLARDLDERIDGQLQSEIPEFEVFDPEAEEPIARHVENEEFGALLGSLPEEVRQAYLRYGDDFKTGYLALNQGDFEQALSYLSKAVQDNPAPDSFIPLELATAYLNLGKTDDARGLLEKFLRQHPDALPAYEMLCEIFWEKNAFKEADALLAAVPQDLAESGAMHLLRGQTLFQAQKYQEAKLHYQNILENYGWNELVVKALAETHEALGEPADARDRYGEIMAQCQSCRASVDPYVKLKYADISFSSGIYTTEILELYLALAREIPANAAACYKKISRVYSALGNETEAKRFRFIAEKLNP